MTALKKYAKLECPGLWRASPGDQRRDVIVSLGEASLVLSDSRSEAPLAHWSLPAVSRRNPGTLPAVFSPDIDAAETLELDEPAMIEALETVQRSLRTGRQGLLRLRVVLSLGIPALLLLFFAFSLPDAVIRHASSVLPQAKRAEIDQIVLADLRRDGYEICAAPAGLRALNRLQERLLGPRAPRIAVLAEGAHSGGLALPGGTILLARTAIDSHDTPEIAAGHILAARMQGESDAPLRAALRAAGLRAVIVLLTTGDLPEGALRGHGSARLAVPPAMPDHDTLLARFEAAGVASTPFAYALDASGETTLRLIEADPYRSASSPTLLSDGDWVSLQGVCGG